MLLFICDFFYNCIMYVYIYINDVIYIYMHNIYLYIYIQYTYPHTICINDNKPICETKNNYQSWFCFAHGVRGVLNVKAVDEFDLGQAWHDLSFHSSRCPWTRLVGSTWGSLLGWKIGYLEGWVDWGYKLQTHRPWVCWMLGFHHGDGRMLQKDRSMVVYRGPRFLYVNRVRYHSGCQFHRFEAFGHKLCPNFLESQNYSWRGYQHWPSPNSNKSDRSPSIETLPCGGLLG